MVWARETAGLTQEAAAAALKLSPDRLAELEGGLEPSNKQLLDMVKAYRRSLLTFYLAEPPKRAERGEDFRTFRDARPPEMESRLDALMRDVQTRQMLIRNILMEEDDAGPLRFVSSLNRDSEVGAVLSAVREAIGISTKDMRQQKDPGAVFSLLRRAVEALGVFVLLLGDLGSHHTAINPKTFRGFVISDPWAPFVVINDKDSKAAWSFTLLHELTHLWIGSSGVSGGAVSGSPIEQLCNDVASKFILPDIELQAFGRTVKSQAPAAVVALAVEFAAERHISPDLVVYRSFRGDFIPRSTWVEVEGLLEDRRREFRQQSPRKKESGGDFYTTRRHRLGGLVDFARKALNEGSLTPTKAALVLGVKARMVHTLVGVS